MVLEMRGLSIRKNEVADLVLQGCLSRSAYWSSNYKPETANVGSGSTAAGMHSHEDFEELEEVSMVDFGSGMSLVFLGRFRSGRELITDLSTTVHSLAVCMLYCAESGLSLESRFVLTLANVINYSCGVAYVIY